MSEKPTQNNSLREQEDQKNKFGFYKTIALLVLFVLIVGYSFIHSDRNEQVPGKDPADQINKQRAVSKRSLNALGQSRQIEFKNKAGQLLISDDGQNLVTFDEKEVLAYKVGTDRAVTLKDIPEDLFRSGAFLPNNEFVMGGESGAGVWSLATGDKKYALKAPGGVETVAVSPDGQMIAGVSRDDGRIWLWESQKGGLLKQSNGNQNSFRPSIFFQDNSQLSVYEISESRGRLLQVSIPSMKITSGPWIQTSENGLRFAASGKWLSGGSTDREITEPELLVFDGRTGDAAGKILLSRNGSGEMIDEIRALTVDAKGIVNLVNLAKGEINQVMDLKGRAELTAVSENGQMAVIKTAERQAIVLPLSTTKTN